MRLRRIWKTGLLLAVGAAGGGAALAVASVPDSNGVVHACYSIDANGAPLNTVNTPNVRIIDPSLGQQCDDTTGSDSQHPTESALNWNQIGRPGPQGRPGRSVTVAGGNTLTLAGGDVVTVAGSNGVTISSPPLTPKSKPIGTASLALGGSHVSFHVFSWSFGRQTTSAGGGGGAGKASTHEIVITKTQDASSAKLFKACATGQHIRDATITVRKAGKGQQEFLVIKLETVLVTSYQTSQSSGGDRPTESLSLNFTKIEFKNS